MMVSQYVVMIFVCLMGVSKFCQAQQYRQSKQELEAHSQCLGIELDSKRDFTVAYFIACSLLLLLSSFLIYSKIPVARYTIAAAITIDAWTTFLTALSLWRIHQKHHENPIVIEGLPASPFGSSPLIDRSLDFLVTAVGIALAVGALLYLPF